MTTTNRLTILQNQIDRADQCYYNENGRGGITDQAYDTMKHELRALAPNDERVSRVGAPISKDNHRKIVKHARLIGSLKDAMTEAEFVAWWPGPSMGSLKIDGLTVENNYVDGTLTTSVTRGDGTEGEDVTANAIQMTGLPRLLPAKFTGQVRGEAYMKVSDLEAVNAKLAMEGGEPYENVRNAASGIIRSTDGRFADFLCFVAHGIEDPSGGLCIDRHFRAYNALKLLGFEVVENLFCETLDEALAYYHAVHQRRPSLDFWIDGTVFLLNDLDAFKKMGVTNKRPKGGIAFKFEPEEAVTTLEDVAITVGHTGRIVPTAVLKPVRIGGTTVSNALLNNWEEIDRLGVVIHDKVVVIKAGDIIPKIIRVHERFLDGSTNDRRSFEIVQPQTCPVCGGKVDKNTNTSGEVSVDLYCQNPECEAKTTGKIARWIKSLDIKGVGDEVLAAMVTYDVITPFANDSQITHKLVRDVADLYRLHAWEDALAEMPINGKRLGERRAKSILAEIEKTRTLTIDEFVGSLGVAGLGKRKVEIIRKAYRQEVERRNTPPNSASYDIDLLDRVDGWLTDEEGSVLEQWGDRLGITNVCVAIQKELNAKKALICDLVQYITIKAPETAPVIAAQTTGPLVGRIFCLTGKFTEAKAIFHEKIIALGGQIREDLDIDVTDLVSADTGRETSKTKKAKKKGLPIHDEQGLKTLLAA